MELPSLSPALIFALTTYTIGVASPGPSNLAIMATAMTRGRSHAVALAVGVVSGSIFWGFAAAFGMSALMRTYSWSLVALKLLGGAYMLWLSWRAARAAFAPTSQPSHQEDASATLRQAYVRGLTMHLTNPKAIFVWLSIVALAAPAGASSGFAFYVVASCATIGAFVFLGYAFAFSTPVARAIYARVHRWFNAALSVVFAFAGIRLLLSRTNAV
jgi:threonine/homoserine/homoserine lactone efflux protein